MIIVLVGPLCSGKDSVAEILSEKGFYSISSGNAIRKDMEDRGLEITRETLQDYARKMRKKIGMFYPANKIVEQINLKDNYVVSGLRNTEEVKEIKKIGNCFVLAVDASERTRFERMKSRRREKDPRTFEEFKKIDDMELYGKGEGGFGFNIRGCMDMADFILKNEGNFEELLERVDEVLKEAGL